ncbi:facilitative transporter for trehalose [Halocaridina rubra]|uniref:Facilitative transporter for trehalose n=1 Tax=Halocaridina rubra TaxID=373956 RepID=A0AAN8ZZV4_HALRR
MQTKGKMHIVYQCMVAASIGMNGLVASMAMGYTSPALPSMKQEVHFSITEDDESWIGSVMPASALIGSLLAGPLLDTFGRRRTFMYLTIPFMISWGIIANAGGVRGVILGRFVSGACVGVQAVGGSVLMPEMAQLDLRKVLVMFPALLGNLGILVSYAAGQYLSWRGLAWLGCALCLPQLILLLPLPETPFYLTQSGKRSSSLAALKKLRQTPELAEREQKELDTSYESRKDKDSKKKKVSLLDLTKPPNLWPVSVGAGLMVAQQTTGLNAVIFYASSIFEAGGDFMDARTSTTLLGLVNFLKVFVGLYCIARYHRRQLIMVSTTALCVSLSVLSAFFWAQKLGGPFLAFSKKIAFMPVLALLCYMGSIPLGWGPVPWVFLSEGTPRSIRGTAAAFIVTVSWGSAFVVTNTFKWSVTSLGIHYVFLGYALVTAISGILLYRTMPETFEMSSAQMEKLYRSEYKMKDE